MEPLDPRAPENRPTFQVARLYRAHGLISRETFLSFEKTFVEIVTTINNLLRENEKLWEYVRTLFAFDDYADCVPINAANLSITIDAVQHCMNAMALDWNRDISLQKRTKPFVYTINAARKLIASQLNVEPDLLALCRNGSDPNAVITNGMDFEPGDEVLVWNENHPTDSDVAWKIRQNRFPNLNLRVFYTEEVLDAKEMVDKFVTHVHAKTRLVTFSEISHLTGTHLPTKALVDRIHEINPDTHVHVDGAQAWGSFKHDLTAMDCDSYSAGSHKWFLGPKETGLLYMKRKCIPNFAPKDIGYNGEMQPPPTLPDDPYGIPFPITDASKFEMVGQRNDTNLIGLLYTADLLELIGFQNIGDRIKALTRQLREGLEIVLQTLPTPPPYEIETPPEEHLYHGILVLKFTENERVGGEMSELVYNALYEDYKIGVSTKKGNRMRLSPHIYNTEKHIDRAVRAIETVLKDILKKDQ